MTVVVAVYRVRLALSGIRVLLALHTKTGEAFFASPVDNQSRTSIIKHIQVLVRLSWLNLRDFQPDRPSHNTISLEKPAAHS